MDVQVANNHYDFFKYLSPERWMSYRHQLELVLKSGCKKVLIIGAGDNIIPAILRAEGIDVETLDIDPKLKPDHVQSVTDIHFENRTFELVLCSQILEHVPFEEMENIFGRLKKITSKKLIISLPEKSLRVTFMVKLPRIKNYYFNFVFPFFFKNHKFDGQHYWELGARGDFRKKFLKIAEKYFTLVDQYRFKPNPYHHFFIFESLK